MPLDSSARTSTVHFSGSALNFFKQDVAHILTHIFTFVGCSWKISHDPVSPLPPLARLPPCWNRLPPAGLTRLPPLVSLLLVSLVSPLSSLSLSSPSLPVSPPLLVAAQTAAHSPSPLPQTRCRCHRPVAAATDLVVSAFLMALALPLGQSVLSLAVDKVWGSMQDKPKRRSRSKKKQDNGESSSGGQRWGYKTWVASGDGLIDKDNSQRPSSFGGWDELDSRGETDNEVRGKQPGRTISRPSQPRPQKGRLSRRMKNSGAPLLLRLLIAIFPFLGSWTKIL